MEFVIWTIGIVAGLGASWWAIVSLMLRENAECVLRDPNGIERPPELILRALSCLAPLAYRQGAESEDEWLQCIRGRVVESLQLLGMEPDPSSFRVYSSSGIEAFSIVANNSLLVAIRGTQGIVDVVTDATFYPKRVPGGFAHSGFWCYGSLLFQKLGLLDEMAARDCEVYITGHSLGGGVAQSVIQLAHLANERGWCPRVSGALLLCSPRAFSWRLARKLRAIYRDRIVRVSRCRDLVAVVPPRCLGFAHIGRQAAYVDRHGQFHPVATWRFRTLDGILGAIRDACSLQLLRKVLTSHSCVETAGAVLRNVHRL